VIDACYRANPNPNLKLEGVSDLVVAEGFHNGSFWFLFERFQEVGACI
jgi:hypothetical protein